MLPTKASYVTLLAALLLLPSLALAAPTASTAGGETSATLGENFLQARQYQLENARLPGLDSIRQSVTAWQITSGQWNGQSLAGLALVLVQSQSDDGQSVRQTNCYISHLASPAQRDALLSAFITAQPQHFSTSQLQSMRIEPAAIAIESQGTTTTLHLGLIA